MVFPPLDDKPNWRALIAGMEAGIDPLLAKTHPSFDAYVERRIADEVPFFDIRPSGVSGDSHGIVLNLHSGGFVMCGGDVCRAMGISDATRLQQRMWSVDYRMPPDHPYPTSLDDCLTVYRALLCECRAEEIIVMGASAGGNLAAAMVLKARDEGLPLPAGVYMDTPAVDLTESGDTFYTNEGLDPALPMRPSALFRLYANGQDLRHPYLSPIFGDFSRGFPPSILTTGTRDLLLSSTVMMHRKLRAAEIPAELHVTEGGGHGGFPYTPEGYSIDRELRQFIRRVLKHQ